MERLGAIVILNSLITACFVCDQDIPWKFRLYAVLWIVALSIGILLTYDIELMNGLKDGTTLKAYGQWFVILRQSWSD